jgi:hypothetical protein
MIILFYYLYCQFLNILTCFGLLKRSLTSLYEDLDAKRCKLSLFTSRLYTYQFSENLLTFN